ncbi:ParM/StbA family protein [Lactobacillus taiwanensis]|jgi:plasmid segregation protein ParM|uniref:ParM/StbA family protein n=1 Tax=Lactobacillus taiwanensis TaxID=508451 RepID=UPI00214AEC56|nr:ParM/StbA family protein [Lactobacillus taiwanensis]MCR1904237.1 ParM/StbA family protein [Lactobacillus taiwanensis]
MKKNKLMVVSNDLGYGAVKMSVDGQYIKEPSVVAEVQQITNDPINSSNEAEVERTISSLLDNLDVTVDKKRYLVGAAASNSTLPRQQFDINSGRGKANTDLAMILPLSIIAAKKIQEAYNNEVDVFEPLKADVVMTTALPISEIGFGNSDHREEFANRFTNKKHIIIFNNFDNPISVTLSFKAVKVFKEGEVATAIAIPHGPEKLRKALVSDIKKNYPEISENMAEELIANSKNVLGIDIGQGTTDLALTTKGNADVFNSVSISEGYGTVLRRAWQFLPRMDKGYYLPDTVALTEVINSEPINKVDRENKETALEAIQTSVPSLVGNIEEGFNAALTANHALEVVYLFGGGSIPLIQQTDLRHQLVDSLQRKRSRAILVWVGEEYSQKLNELGLEMLANEIADTLA